MTKIDNAVFRFEPSVMFTADDTYPMAREPVLRRMPDGSLLSLIYCGGPREPHWKNIVAAVRSEDGGKSWSKPEELFRHPRRACWGTELFTEGETPFLVFQTFDVPGFYLELRSFVSFTEDSGRSWSEPRSFHGVPSNFSVRQGRVLSDGSWLFPVYWEELRRSWDGSFGDDGLEWPFVSGVIRSTDRGQTWKLHVPQTNAENQHLWEPEVIELAPGHLKMFIRRESPEHVLWESESFDFGATWSAPLPGKISNPGTKTVIYKVRSRWVMFNNLCPEGRCERSELSMLVSDDGENWRNRGWIAKLETVPEENPFSTPRTMLPQVAYPHGFSDDREECVLLAIDSIRKFFFVRIPYSEILD